MRIRSLLFIATCPPIGQARALTSVSQAKTIGGVGSILVVLSAVPTAGSLLGIAGFILVLVAVKGISDSVGDRSIFNDALLAVGLAIAGVVAGTLVLLGSFLSFMGLHNMAFANFGQGFDASSIPRGDWMGLIGSAFAGLAIVWLTLLASAIFIRRSYGAIASKLGVDMFRTAGLLFLVGAATTIVLVGFLLLFVAQVLLAVAFFSIDETKVG